MVAGHHRRYPLATPAPSRAPSTRHRALTVLLLGLGSCAVPARPQDPARVAAAVAKRATTVAEATRALELAGLQPLFERAPAGDPQDPDTAAPWHAFAWAYGRETVTARRRLLAARAAAGSAGKPAPLGLGADTADLDEPDGQGQVRLTFDLLGLFGLGRTAAAQQLASATERRAVGALEEAAWSTPFAVDRARVRLAAARARTAALQALLAEVTADQRRLDILADRGWLAPDRVDAARAMANRLRRQLTTSHAAVGERRAALAVASGLPPTAAVLDAVQPRSLARFAPLAPPRALPADAMLLAGLPTLRRQRLEYAVAEARLQRAAAETWPDLRIGPRLQWTPGTTLVGGVLDLSLPWPGSVTGFVAAAHQERELARELLEHALVAAAADAAARRTRLLQAQQVLRHHAPAIATGTADAWTAARARFAADPASLPLWTDRLERRITGCVASVDATEQAILAMLDYREAIGPELPRPEVQR